MALLDTYITVVKVVEVDQKCIGKDKAHETSLLTVRKSLDNTLAIFKWSDNSKYAQVGVQEGNVVWKGTIQDWYEYEEQNRDNWIAEPLHPDDKA